MFHQLLAALGEPLAVAATAGATAAGYVALNPACRARRRRRRLAAELDPYMASLHHLGRLGSR